MPHPVTKQLNIRKALADYLTIMCDRFFSDMDWEYYRVDSGYVEEPKGAVFLRSIQRKDNYPVNVDYVPKVYKFHISLKLFDEDSKTALDKATAWEEEIGDRIIKKLQIEGYQGLFRGIHCDRQQPSIIQEAQNQDDGGRINLHMFLVWDDDGIIESSLNIPDYLLDN